MCWGKVVTMMVSVGHTYTLWKKVAMVADVFLCDLSPLHSHFNSALSFNLQSYCSLRKRRVQCTIWQGSRTVGPGKLPIWADSEPHGPTFPYLAHSNMREYWTILDLNFDTIAGVAALAGDASAFALWRVRNKSRALNKFYQWNFWPVVYWTSIWHLPLYLDTHPYYSERCVGYTFLALAYIGLHYLCIILRVWRYLPR